MLLFVGERLGLREHIEGRQTNPGKRSPQAAERGELAAGAIPYRISSRPAIAELATLSL